MIGELNSNITLLTNDIKLLQNDKETGKYSIFGSIILSMLIL